MVFFGTHSCLVGWKKVISDEFDKEGSKIITVDDRKQFSVVLTAEEREVLQEKYWYKKEPGEEFAWNMRIAFQHNLLSFED